MTFQMSVRGSQTQVWNSQSRAQCGSPSPFAKLFPFPLLWPLVKALPPDRDM
jgi:hypothetical protein